MTHSCREDRSAGGSWQVPQTLTAAPLRGQAGVLRQKPEARGEPKIGRRPVMSTPDTPTPIPDPVEARVLRGVFATNPAVTLAAAWLRSTGIEHVHDALKQLPAWQHYAELSERER